jgi:anti-sigma B factor antagonist
MSLNISTREVKGVEVLDLSGRITLGEGTGALREYFKKALASGKKQFVFNMTGVSYVDSAGLGELVGCRTSATNAGAQLILAGLQKKITDLMTITKLHTVFEVHETEEGALNSFAQGSAASH